MPKTLPLTRSLVRSVAIAVVTGIGLGLVASAPAAAQPTAESVLTTAPLTVAPGDTIQVTVTNLGPRPVRVTLGVADADDLSTIWSHGPTVVGPRSSVYEFFSPNNTELIVKVVLGFVRIQARSAEAFNGIRASLQVFNADGETRIFTDGFESGDLAR